MFVFEVTYWFGAANHTERRRRREAGTGGEGQEGRSCLQKGAMVGGRLEDGRDKESAEGKPHITAHTTGTPGQITIHLGENY